ncbi:MAG TPA: ParA family protein [Candidatus Ventrousia excrementavium]|uniref:Sporulation initiation inhibitor protein Soj n=1 Tax=Candidatus Ventrousia excrementavium TaxID=2840961 RepID=A0A9D1LJS9_9CLOT|nr:ParA family protein [Candidatus Ventrousia excrementavium]
MGKIIALSNQKGGVGKTTTAVNTACCVAARGQRVLLCDFDPQGNASSGLGVAAGGKGIYGVLTGQCTVQQALCHTRWCDLLPADINLAAIEQELAGTDERQLALRSVLAPLRGQYDYIFIDCPPSLGLLTINALAAADTVLVPMQCEYYALEGLTQLVSTIRTVKRSINPPLDIEGIVLTMYDGRTNLTLQVAEEIKRYFGPKVFKTVVPRNVRLSEAPSHGKPIIAYDRLSRGAEAYTAIADELLRRNKGGR